VHARLLGEGADRGLSWVAINQLRDGGMLRKLVGETDCTLWSFRRAGGLNA